MQDQTLWILIGAVVVLGLLFWLIARRRKSAALREHFGDEYDRTVEARGYPMADFDRRYEDLTVEHSEVARHYREGHEITVRHEEGKASTEDLRQAMIHFEALFDDLVNEVTDEHEMRDLPRRERTR